MRLKEMEKLFEMALGLGSDWYVSDIAFAPEEGRLDISIDFERGTRFTCPECGQEGCPVHDTVKRTWRHLNFFQFETYIHARVPRATCEKCGVHQVQVPWARSGSGFTLLFESLAMALVKLMPVRAAARILNMWSTRLWRIIHHHVDAEEASLDLSGVVHVGLDETSSRKGHNYITVFADLDTKRVIFVAEGKGADTLEKFKAFLESHGGHADKIELFSCDMSTAFTAGIQKHFQKSEIVYDRFHVTKLVQEALDEICRGERKELPDLLRKTRYIWLRNPENLSDKQHLRLEELRRAKYGLKSARAWSLKEFFRNIFNRDPQDMRWGEHLFDRWYFWATHSRLEPMIKVARTLKKHKSRILRSIETGLSNGLMEGLNSLIQAAKAKARGFSSLKSLKALCYLVGGKFELGITRLWWLTHTG